MHWLPPIDSPTETAPASARTGAAVARQAGYAAEACHSGRKVEGSTLTLATGAAPTLPAAATLAGIVVASAAAGFVAALLGVWMLRLVRRSRGPAGALEMPAPPTAPTGASLPEEGAVPLQPTVEQLARELETARRQLQEGLVERERFLSNVSHEIKTPIAILMIEAQTVDRRACTEGMLHFVETVESEMARLGRLVESFLLLTRVQSGRGPSTLRCYALNDMIIDSIESCAAAARQGHISLRPSLLSEEATVDASVVGDPYLLRTLVEHLLRNSIRFSPPGSTIDVVAKVNGGTAEVSVIDQGPGIDPDRLKNIFDRFANKDDSQRLGRGQGLGLAVAKGIAELHGGTIQAFNREGAGCEFMVRLKLADAAQT